MSETKYESVITKSTSNVSDIYNVLSNLENIERVKDLIPEDKVKDIEVTADSIRFKVDGLGQKVNVRIVERETNSTIKFAVENLPVAANFWIQTKAVADHDTRLRLTFKADMPTMFAMMLGNKLQDGINRAAEMLAQFPYEQWNQKA